VSFNNLRILTKLLLMAGALATVMLTMAGVGAWKASDIAHDVGEAGKANEGVKLAARMHQNVLVMGLEPFRLSAQFSAATLASVRTDLQETRAIFAQRVTQIEAMGGERRLRALAEVKARYADFTRHLDASMAVAAAAEAANDFGDASRVRLREANAAMGLSLSAVRTALTNLGDVADVVADELKTSAMTAAASLTMLMLILAGSGVVIAGLLTWLIGLRAISRPVAVSAQRLRALAEGDTESAITGQGRRDEIGAVAAAMTVFRENLLATRAHEAAEGRRKQALAEAAHAARLDMAANFEREIGGVVKTVASAATEMEATAAGMAEGARGTAREAASVKKAAEQASANVQTVAAAAEELTASVAEISRQMASSSRMAEEAVAEAGRTGATVQSLAEKAQRIGEVVQLINAIAGQTNLLALNATIEAARAGEAGKGFAVVASEVKSLATQTGKATEDIASQVQAVQAETARVVTAITAMGAVIGKLSEIATGIAAAVEEQGAATAEIARNVQEASSGTNAVSTNIVKVDEAATSSGAAASQVQAAAKELSQGAESLRSQVDQFLAAMRAA